MSLLKKKKKNIPSAFYALTRGGIPPFTMTSAPQRGGEGVAREAAILNGIAPLRLYLQVFRPAPPFCSTFLELLLAAILNKLKSGVIWQLYYYSGCNMYRVANRVQCFSHPASRVTSVFPRYNVGKEEGRWLSRV